MKIITIINDNRITGIQYGTVEIPENTNNQQQSDLCKKHAKAHQYYTKAAFHRNNTRNK